jgi:anaerobic selenocysteine-containing dehydrogenase
VARLILELAMLMPQLLSILASCSILMSLTGNVSCVGLTLQPINGHQNVWHATATQLYVILST